MKTIILLMILNTTSLFSANNFAENKTDEKKKNDEKKVVIEDFEGLTVGRFPKEWGVKKGFWYTSGEGNKTWKVRKEDNNLYLSAESVQDSYTIGKKYKYDLKKYKYLKWRWRVQALPEGADEEHKKTGDSAAGIYVVFPGFYSIKYVWSTSRDVGYTISSPFLSRSKIIVVRSGKEQIGTWLAEKRNVYEDFKKVFNVKVPDKTPKGIALLTDSDNTKTFSKADYDDIEVTVN